jgi:endonuclease/exonuclease/phosphatase family metal-dependent hydrolase
MRLVSWNCHHGETRQRAARLDSLCPDLVVLQECGKPTAAADGRCVWFGNQPTKGVGVVSRGRWFVEPGPVDPDVPDSVYPVRVCGPVEFHLLAIWAQKRPTYVRAILAGLAAYRDFLMAASAVVVGDFNSHPRWDADDPKANHSLLAERLRQDFGLVSAYHAVAERSDSTIEKPTFYWQWREAQPFHLDYCFLPTQWAARLASVEVGGYPEWADESDHRPLVAEFALT